MASLVFTKDQLHLILRDFAAIFDNPIFKVQLAAVAPDEQKMEQIIENYQTDIFRHHNIDPTRGFADLTQAGQVYGNDQHLMKLLGVAATKEDMAFREALGQFVPEAQTPNNAPTVQAMPSLQGPSANSPLMQPGVDPRMFEQMKQFAKENPEQFSKQVMLARQIASNPQMAYQLRDQLIQRVADNPALQPQLDQINNLIASMPAQAAAAATAGAAKHPSMPSMRPPSAEDMHNDMD